MKKIVYYIAILGCIFTIVGCSNYKSDVIPSLSDETLVTVDSTSSIISNESESNNNVKVEGVSNIRFDEEAGYQNIITGGIRCLAENEEGYYFTKKIGINYYLYYYDKETNQSIPLCAKPNCKHNDINECNASLGIHAYDIFLYKDNIYSIVAKDKDVTSNITLIQLISIAIDGTERNEIETILEFEGSRGSMFRSMLIKDDIVYFSGMLEQLEEDKVVLPSGEEILMPIEKNYIFSIPITGGKYSTIYEIEALGMYHLIRLYEGKDGIWIFDLPVLDWTDDDNNKIYYYNTKEKKMTPVFQEIDLDEEIPIVGINLDGLYGISKDNVVWQCSEYDLSEKVLYELSKDIQIEEVLYYESYYLVEESSNQLSIMDNSFNMVATIQFPQLEDSTEITAWSLSKDGVLIGVMYEEADYTMELVYLDLHDIEENQLIEWKKIG